MRRSASGWQTAPRRLAGSRTTLGALVARAKQQWLFVELCMREPLMIAPLGHGLHPHALQAATGVGLGSQVLRAFDREVSALEQKEAN